MYKSEVYDESGMYAKVVCDSIANDSRLITIETYAPKFLDAEFEKHKMIPSNSSSDRAIPMSKSLANKPFIPTDVRYQEKGMQGSKKVLGTDLEDFQWTIKNLHTLTCNMISPWADKEQGEPVHKQHLNRYLLPWAMQYKVMTANVEWFEYLFSLRSEYAADPAMQIISNLMKEAVDKSKPQPLKDGQWHLPYFNFEEWETTDFGDLVYTDDAIKCSVARLARVSFTNHDKSNPELGKDIKLHDDLLEAKHMSCFSHVATPIRDSRIDGAWHDINDPWNPNTWDYGITHVRKDGTLCSNHFHDWIQYRALVE